MTEEPLLTLSMSLKDDREWTEEMLEQTNLELTWHRG